MRQLAIVIACAAAELSSSPGLAQSFEAKSPEMPNNLADSQVVNGIRVLVPSDWPATFVFRGLGTRPCTATVIGPRAVLTAAHCITAQAQADLEVAGNKYHLTCQAHGDANPPEYDIALCVAKVDIMLRGPTDRYESVPKLDQFALAGQPLTLLGFGCTAPHAPDFGVLYQGGTMVIKAPQATAPSIETKGGAIACDGDSGGAAYFRQNNRRYMVGVNSRSLSSNTQLSALTDSETQKLLRDATQPDDNNIPQKVRICGLDDTLPNCR